MSKIKINSTLKTTNEVIKKEFMGILIEDKIIYNDDAVNVTFSFKNNELIMKRSSKEYSIEFKFSKNNTTKCVYNVKSENIIVYLDIKTKRLIIEDNRVIVDYELYQQNELVESVVFEIIYEVV